MLLLSNCKMIPNIAAAVAHVRRDPAINRDIFEDERKLVSLQRFTEGLRKQLSGL
jgi:hypothetical protein